MKTRNSYPSIKASKYLIYSEEFPEIKLMSGSEKLKNFEFSPRRLKSSKSPQASMKLFADYSNLSTESSDWSPDDIQGSFDFTQTEPEQEVPKSQCAVTVQVLPKSNIYNLPLEVIQENSFEDLKKRPKKQVHKSQQPRAIHLDDKTTFPYNSPPKHQKYSQKILRSPYSPSKLSQFKLPTLKNSGKTFKIAKKFKDLINNKHAV